jgi:hypothetical protein
MWKADSKDFEKEKEECKKLPVLKYKGQEFRIDGFNIARDKNEKIVFAYKFKHEKKDILYYVDTDDKEILKAVNFIKKTASLIGYDTTDMKISLDSIANEMITMKARDKKKEEENKNKKL